MRINASQLITKIPKYIQNLTYVNNAKKSMFGFKHQPHMGLLITVRKIIKIIIKQIEFSITKYYDLLTKIRHYMHLKIIFTCLI